MARRAKASTNGLPVRDQLGLFAHEVDVLSQRRLVRDGMDASFTVSFDRMKGMSIRVNEVDEEDLRAYLTGFRKFISEGEPVFLNHIYNLLDQRLTSPDLKQQLRESRAYWKEAFKGKGMKVTFNERDLTPEYVMDLLINGEIFHTDWQKRQTLRSIWPTELTRFMVNNLIVEATRVLFYVGNVVQFALHENLIAES